MRAYIEIGKAHVYESNVMLGPGPWEIVES